MTNKSLPIIQRLAFIDAAIVVKERVSAFELQRAFSITRQAASGTISLYIKRAPKNIYYNSSEKRYLRTEHFKATELDRFGVTALQFLDAIAVISIVDMDYVFEDLRTNRPRRKPKQSKIIPAIDSPFHFKTKFYSYQQEMRKISEISEITGLNKTMLYKRLKHALKNSDVNAIIQSMIARKRK